ncbi:hypothetical protein PMAYCL1PPCAC_27179, partial [Pristionchus mayeri]
SEFSPDQAEKSQPHDNLVNEILIATAGHSPLNQKVLKESHLIGDKLNPFLSCPIPSNDDSGEADGIGHSVISSPCASPLSKKKKLLNNQEERNNSDDEIDCIADPAEYSVIESLQWRARPALKRIFSHLHTNEECTDLYNLYEACPLFYSGVRGFMKRDINRAGLKLVRLRNSEGSLEVRCVLYPDNLPFYDLESLESSGRLTRHRHWGQPALQVTLTGLEDLIEQLSKLISLSIKDVEVGENSGVLSPSNLELCAKMLSNATVGTLRCKEVSLDDITVPLIISIASRAKEFHLRIDSGEPPSDPEAFITQLFDVVSASVYLDDYRRDSFFDYLGFWKRFLNEKLSNRSIVLAVAKSLGGAQRAVMRMAPINLPFNPVHMYWTKIIQQ